MQEWIDDVRAIAESREAYPEDRARDLDRPSAGREAVDIHIGGITSKQYDRATDLAICRPQVEVHGLAGTSPHVLQPARQTTLPTPSA